MKTMAMPEKIEIGDPTASRQLGMESQTPGTIAKSKLSR